MVSYLWNMHKLYTILRVSNYNVIFLLFFSFHGIFSSKNIGFITHKVGYIILMLLTSLGSILLSILIIYLVSIKTVW
jgi:hypothetical protein